jgi:transcriptional regulator with XRE-family HTH domain
MIKSTDRQMDATKRNLKIAIALDDLSAAEICRIAGLSPNVVGKFLRGETSISFQNLVAVCSVINIPVGLITDEFPITQARIQLYRTLCKIPEDQIEAALAKITEAQSGK